MHCNAFHNKILLTQQPCCILNQLDYGRDAAGRTDRDQIRNSLWINSNDSLSISGQSLTSIFGQYLVNNNSATVSIFVKDVPSGHKKPQLLMVALCCHVSPQIVSKFTTALVETTNKPPLHYHAIPCCLEQAPWIAHSMCYPYCDLVAQVYHVKPNHQ